MQTLEKNEIKVRACGLIRREILDLDANNSRLWVVYATLRKKPQ